MHFRLIWWPMPRPRNWTEYVNREQTPKELEKLRTAVRRGSPFGSPSWQSTMAKRLSGMYSKTPRAAAEAESFKIRLPTPFLYYSIISSLPKTYRLQSFLKCGKILFSKPTYMLRLQMTTAQEEKYRSSHYLRHRPAF